MGRYAFFLKYAIHAKILIILTPMMRGEGFNPEEAMHKAEESRKKSDKIIWDELAKAVEKENAVAQKPKPKKPTHLPQREIKLIPKDEIELTEADLIEVEDKAVLKKKITETQKKLDNAKKILDEVMREELVTDLRIQLADLKDKMKDAEAEERKEKAAAAEKANAATREQGAKILEQVEKENLAAQNRRNWKERADKPREGKTDAEAIKEATSIENLKSTLNLIGYAENDAKAKVMYDAIDEAYASPSFETLSKVHPTLREKVQELIDEKAIRDAEEQDRRETRKTELDKKAAELIAAAYQRAEQVTNERDDDFFARGEEMTRAHKAGKVPSRNDAEEYGEEKQRQYEMSADFEKTKEEDELAKIEANLPEFKRQLRLAQELVEKHGIKDIDEAVAARATSGILGKAKRLFGGLFDKKARERDAAIDLYISVAETLSYNEGRKNELKKTQEEINEALRVKARRQPPRASSGKPTGGPLGTGTF